MKFKGPPNMTIRDIRKNKVYRFDENGFFETEDKSVIRRMSVKFKTVGEQPKKAPAAKASPAINTPAQLICPKCGRECKSALGLASHERACKG